MTHHDDNVIYQTHPISQKKTWIAMLEVLENWSVERGTSDLERVGSTREYLHSGKSPRASRITDNSCAERLFIVTVVPSSKVWTEIFLSSILLLITCSTQYNWCMPLDAPLQLSTHVSRAMVVKVKVVVTSYCKTFH